MNPQPHARATRLALLLLLLAGACDSPADVRLAHVPSLTLDAIGDSKQLVAVVRGTEQLPTWESDHPGIATVTRAGMVTAVAPGTATVRAQLGREAREGTVEVLPPVSVEIISVAREPIEGGEERATLRIHNAGGRGYFRVTYYRAAATPGALPQIVSQQWSDLEVAARQPEFTFGATLSTPADWVVIHSREPNSIGYRVTACAPFDGEAGCPAS